MAKGINEWVKGITFFIFVTLLFYFLWQYIFSNIIEFVGTDIFNLGSTAATSIAIMKTVAWISFVALYLGVGGVYLLYSIIIGAKGETETKPLYLLKAITIWSIGMPLTVFFFGLTFYMIDTLNSADLISTAMETTASTFGWIVTLIIMSVLTILPFYYILIGYGVIDENEKSGKGGNND